MLAICTKQALAVKCSKHRLWRMNKLTDSKRAAVVPGSMVEGNSIRSHTRMTGVSKGAVLRLPSEVGEFCAVYLDYRHRKLPCCRVEADEIWGFFGAKEKNATKPGQSDLWTYAAICAGSKLLVSWVIGRRNHENTQDFMADVAARLAHRVQLSTDGLAWYLSAVENAFGWNNVDYAQLVKTHARSPRTPVSAAIARWNAPGRSRRQSWAIRMCRWSALAARAGGPLHPHGDASDDVSKKAGNHPHAFAIHAMFYNFCRPHRTLTKAMKAKTTPAMACDLTDRVWTVEDVFALMGPARLLH